ncbi:MAG: AmmeMemoRadiSam system radical SAM enzyme [bacterium]|nr:AmmeMemoRadiSam system radical SAM enzyme [bacterium]
MRRRAAYFEKVSDGKESEVVCLLCPANCRLSEGQRGICDSRLNHSGELVTENYGELVSCGIDPIEKKPLFHFYPGAKILSTGTTGCNFGCLNCQNWQISQRKQPTTFVSPEQLVEMAGEQGSIGVAFTYTEPMIWFEYVRDVAPLLKQRGLKTVLVSNGYVNREPLLELIELIDAVNIDLKSVRPEFYKKICKGKLEPVLENIELLSGSEVHMEITNLVIPGQNDSDEEIGHLVQFVSDLSPEIPVHFSAFHPDYKLSAEITPDETLTRVRKIARERLSYVYIGNSRIAGAADTICPQCQSIVIRRENYQASLVGLDGQKCRTCGWNTKIIL